MNLHKLLTARAAEGRPVQVGLVGAGKFGTMFLAQARNTVGVHLLGIADLDLDRARAACKRTGWSTEQIASTSFPNALKSGATFLTDNTESLIEADGLEVLIEATGDPAAGIRHCLKAIDQGRHIIMVNVEADVVAGAKYVIIKKGEHGSLLFFEDIIFPSAAFSLEKIVDPTGAGDSFAGAMMGYLTSKNKTDLAAIKKSVIYGNVMGSFAVEGYGPEVLLRIKKSDIKKRMTQYEKMVRF